MPDTPPVVEKPKTPQRKRARCRNVHAATRFHVKEETANPIAGSETSEADMLTHLPRELLLRILRMLSAQDLTACSRTCTYLRSVGDDEILWRRLYFARWGQFEGCESKVIHSRFWKATYMERDSREYTQRVPLAMDGALLPLFHSMQLSQRALCVKREREPSWSQLTGSEQEKVATFRREKGFGPEAAERPTDLRSAMFARFGDVYVEEASGWVHICDATCSEVVPDDNGAFMVCGLTGRVHGAVMCEDEATLCCDPAVDETGDADFQPGWLGRAYEDGYTLDNEADDSTSLVSPALLAMGKPIPATKKRKRVSSSKSQGGSASAPSRSWDPTKAAI